MFWIILIALVGVVWFFLKRNVDAIKQNENRFAYDRLSQDPQGKTVYVECADGGHVRVVMAGEGPVVVLTHGYGANLVEWNVVMDQLVADGYRVFAFDLLGHGGSKIGSDGVGVKQMAASYKAVLAHFELTDAVLVGHSTGGFVAISMLLNFPETAARLKGLVLLASTAGDVSKGAPQNKVQIPLIKSGLMTAICKTELLGYPFGASLMGIDPSSAVIRVFLEVFAGQDHSQLIPILRDIDETSYYDRLGEIEVPTAVICGKKDGTTPPWHSEQLGRDIPHAENLWVPDRGHMLNWEAPEVVVGKIAELHDK